MLIRHTALGTIRVTLLTLTLVLVAGCGTAAPDPDQGTNGIGRQSPGTIVAEARAAALAASSVRLSGSVVSGGAAYRLDMLLSADGGTGKVSNAGRTFELLRVGSKLYVKGDAAFYADAGASAAGAAKAAVSTAASTLEGRYVRVHSSDPAYQELSVFTDKAALLGSVVDLGGKVHKGDRTEVAGRRTVAVTADGGNTLQVSLEGTPYPVRVERAGHAGTLNLTDFGKHVTITAPDADQVLDYGTGVHGRKS